jgi:hypothetical protein
MGVVNTTYTFTSTDTITSAKMNNIIDDTTFTSDAIQGTTLQVVSPGKLAVSAGGITSNEMASNSVVTAAITDSSVTNTKIEDGAVTNTKIANGSVGFNKLLDNAVGTVKIQDNAITAPKLSGAQTGTAPIYGCRAWVNFNGIGTTGTNMTIRASGNVSSVNKLGTGRYRVTFTTPMLDANYAAIVGGDANAPHKIPGVITQNTAYVDIGYSQINTSTARDDPDWGSVVIMR